MELPNKNSIIFVFMKQKENKPQESIDNISFDKLLFISKIVKKENLFNDECILIREDTDTDAPLFKYPLRINAYIFVVCSKGTFELTCNLRHYTVSPNTLLIYEPGNIIQLNTFEPGEMAVVMLKPEFLKKLNINIKKIALNFQHFQESFFTQLSPDECSVLMDIHAVAEDTLKGNRNNPFFQNMLLSMINAFVYKALYIIVQNFKPISDSSPNPGRKLFHFNKFMHLLSLHYREHHSIRYYASEMSLTPKYLSLIIKEFSGKLATQWIDEYVILEAKNLIKYSEMSIQEIAYTLHFSNQSFFGKYFKKHTGFSPKEYREQE